MRKRTFKIECDAAVANTRWKEPTITFNEYKNGDIVKSSKVVIMGPWQLRQVEVACKKIREYWQEQCR